MIPIEWSSKWSFGKYKETGETILQVLITDKEWLSWCFREKLDEKFAELRFIRNQVKPAEWSAILKGGST